MEIVELLHIVGAIFLVGPLTVAGTYGARAARSGSPEVLGLLRRIAVVFGWGALVVGILGFGLVSDGWSFSEPWILLSIALFVVAVGLTLGGLAPSLGRAERAAAAEGPAGSQRLVGPIAGTGMAVTALYLLVALLMVLKPF